MYCLNRNSRTLEFLLERRIPENCWEELYARQEVGTPAWYYMSLDGEESQLYSVYEVEEELSLSMYHINRIKPGFMDPNSREKYLEQRFLQKLQAGKKIDWATPLAFPTGLEVYIHPTSC